METKFSKYKKLIELQLEELTADNALQAALRRLSEGEFGYCMECGDEIGEVGSLLNPAVLECMACLTG